MKRINHLSILLALLAPLACVGATTYTVQTLSYPSATQTYAQAINSSGVVAGYYTDTSGTSHGFIWYAGKFTPVNIPGVNGTWLTGINDSEDICGYIHVISSGAGSTLGFTIQGTKFSSFTAPNSRGTFASSINNAGAIAGYDETGTLANGTYFGFILSSAVGGTFSPLNVTGQTNNWVLGMNNLLDAVGFAGANLDPTTPVEAFAYNRAKSVTSPVNMAGMVQTRFYGINDLGTIVGYGLDSSQITHSFTYRFGTFTAFTIPNFNAAIPQSINNAGVIVGYAITGSNTVVGFIAKP